MKIGDLCPTLNLKNNKIEFEPVRAIYSYPFEGTLFHIKNKFLNMKITSAHKSILNIAKERKKKVNKK